MTVVDELVRANSQHSGSATSAVPGEPRRRLTIITCMDCRLDMLYPLGLEIGDAHVIRNAGGIPTDDVLRSLAISQRALGTREVAIIHHTQCGMNGFDDDAFRAELTAESGQAPPWHVDGFTDVTEDTRRSVQIVRTCPWLPHRDAVRGFVIDVGTARLTEVD